jgi:tetratricopeptide (TPR) repeat protein
MAFLKDQINQAFELFDKGYLVEAEELYHDCLSQITEASSDQYVNILHGLGYVKVALSKFDEARSHYGDLIKITVSKGDSMNHSIAVHQLGMVERSAENYDEALKLFQLEAELLKKYNNNESPLNWSANFYERGFVNFKMGNIINAEQLMCESLQHAKESEDDICIGCSYRGYGEVFQNKNDEVLAETCFKNAIAAFERAKDYIAIEEVNELLTGLSHSE